MEISLTTIDIIIIVGIVLMFLLIVFRINPFKCCCKCKSKNDKLLDEHLPIINDVFINDKDDTTDI